jgi:site-specific recombinase XerD
VPFNETCGVILEKYISKYGAISKDGLLIVGKEGDPLNPGYITFELGRISEVVGLSQTLTARGMRHRFATQLVKKGMGVRYVQKDYHRRHPRALL